MTTVISGSYPAVTSDSDATVNGITVGKGGGAVSTNTALGVSAGAANTTGADNVFLGNSAGKLTTTGTDTVVIGSNALSTNTTGTENIAIGSASLLLNTTGSNNVAVGRAAMRSNTTASNNTAVGYQAGYSASTSTSNVFIGAQAGYNLTATGDNRNTFVGPYAGYFVTTGTKNTILGGFNGLNNGPDIRTASNYIVLSDGDGNARMVCNSVGQWLFPQSTGTLGVDSGYPTFGQNQTGLMFLDVVGSRRIIPRRVDISGASDNIIDLGDSGSRFKTIYAGTGTINTSDANEKQDIADLDDVEKRVALRIKQSIKKFKFKDAVAIKGDSARIHVGVIAQEVAAAFSAENLDASRYAMFCSDTWYEVDGKSFGNDGVKYTAETPNALEKTRLGIRYDELLAFVIAVL